MDAETDADLNTDVVRTDRYDAVRGTLVGVPDKPGGNLQIDHEALPSFKRADGDVVGMKEMVMPFPLGDGVELGGLGPGDPITFSFEVRWRQDGVPSYAVTEIQRRDADADADADPMP